MFDPGGANSPPSERLAQIEQHIHNARAQGRPTLGVKKDHAEVSELLLSIAKEEATITAKREHAMRQWERRARDPEVQTRNEQIIAGAAPEVKHAIQHMNLALLDEMLKHCNHEDTTLVAEITAGFRLTGRLTSNGVYRPRQDPRGRHLDKEQALDEAPKRREELDKLARACDGPYAETLWDQAQQDALDHKLLGPLDERAMALKFGDKWLYSHRFPKPEATKTRAIDDPSQSQVNDMCVIDEHLYLDDIDSLVNTAQAAYRADAAYNVKNRQYLLWRGDHKDAYRQFPISPTDHSVASIRLPVPREKRGPTWPHSSGYYVHLRLPFGARGSMLHYSRVSRAVCAILRRLLWVPLLAYVDDYYAICPEEQASHCHALFQRVNRALGFQIKEEKTMLPAVEGKLLGIKLTISPSAITMDVDEQRRQKLQEQLRLVRQNKRLSPTLAGKLAGKLGFAGTAFWGKNGRAFLRALYNRAARRKYQSEFDEKHEIARALDWFQWALVHCPRRCIPLGQQQQASTIYTDAEFSVNQQGAMTGRIGSVILLPNNATRFVSWQVPSELFTKLEPRETQITPLEVLAVPFSLHHWLADKKALGEAHKNPEGIIVTVYIDSTAAQFCIRKGSSRQDDMNALAAETWKMSAANNITLWTEHVSSEENGADLPSRNMITACEAMGWQASPVQYDVPWRKWLAAVEAPIEGLQEGH